MKYEVKTHRAKKDLKRIPKDIKAKFELWSGRVETMGLPFVQENYKGYHDHPLHGDREGQRSVHLTYAWIVIYTLDEVSNELKVLNVEEVNKHKYK
jgi:proteic killer suppression protein